MMPLPKVPDMYPLPGKTKESMAIKESETVFSDLGHLDERLQKLTDVITNLGESMRAVSIESAEPVQLKDDTEVFMHRSQLSKLIRKSSDDVQRLIRDVTYLHEHLDL